MSKFYFTSKVWRMSLCLKITSISEQVLKNHLFILSTSPILVQKSWSIKFVVILINSSYLLMLLLSPIKLCHFQSTRNALKLLLKLDTLNLLMTMIVSFGTLWLLKALRKKQDNFQLKFLERLALMLKKRFCLKILSLNPCFTRWNVQKELA